MYGSLIEMESNATVVILGSGRGGRGAGLWPPFPDAGRGPPKFLCPGLAGGACSPGIILLFPTTYAVTICDDAEINSATEKRSTFEILLIRFINYKIMYSFNSV